MLHIILGILKWIGILLLAILLLVLLIILSLLFVPIRYKVKGSYTEKPDASVTVSWLLHLIHVKVRYRDALFWQVRILGIPFLDSRRKKKETQNRTYRSKDKKKHATVVQNEIQQYETPAEEIKSDVIQDEAPKEHVGLFSKIKLFFKKLFQFISAVFRGIAKVFHNIRYTIGKICDKIREIRDNIGYYHDIITGKEGRESIELIKRELGRMLLHVAPRKFKLDASFGFDDPATTGQVMAILGMLYPIWSYDVSLHPDFENKVMAGHIYMRGRIRLFTLIRIAWRVYFNKNLKKVLVMLQKGGTKHG